MKWDLMDAGKLEPLKVADVRNELSNVSFVYVSGENEESVWPGEKLPCIWIWNYLIVNH